MEPQATLEAGDYTISGPHPHENLSVYLVSGADAVEAARFLTLREAMEQEKVVVHETGEVSSLVIENLTEDEAVFVQTGDIVKGGRQDRTFQLDVIVRPGEKVPVGAYCVEKRRWGGRGGENSRRFTTSHATVSSSKTRTTILRGLSQSDTWASIEETQTGLADSIGDEVRSSESPSSLALTSEGETVRAAVDDYVSALSGVLDRADLADDVIGCVVAVNGAVDRADIYGASVLFRKLWPSLLRSAAEEAVARRPLAKEAGPPSLDEVGSYLEESRKGDASEEKATGSARTTTVVSGDTTYFETRIAEPADAWVHRGYLTAAT